MFKSILKHITYSIINNPEALPHPTNAKHNKIS